MLREDEQISKLEEIIGYTFQNKEVAREALTHSSYANERKINKIACNERLEFLGDSVLQIISSDYLFHEMKDSPEGKLSKTRSSLVCEPALAKDAMDIGLHECIFLGKGEELGGGRKKPSVVSDAFEAVIGAIYLDGGLEQAKDFIYKFALEGKLAGISVEDPKSALQQYYQRGGAAVSIVYETTDEYGPEHDKHFVVTVTVNGKLAGKGEGHNKKAAEKEAARDALSRVQNS